MIAKQLYSAQYGPTRFVLFVRINFNLSLQVEVVNKYFSNFSASIIIVFYGH